MKIQPRPGGNRKWSKENLDRIRTMREEGMSYSQIAARLGICKSHAEYLDKKNRNR